MQSFNEWKINEATEPQWVSVAIDKKGSITITSRPMVGEQAVAFITGQPAIGSRGEVSALMLVTDVLSIKDRTVLGKEYL
jgi:hypothetical protein